METAGPPRARAWRTCWKLGDEGGALPAEVRFLFLLLKNPHLRVRLLTLERADGGEREASMSGRSGGHSLPPEPPLGARPAAVWCTGQAPHPGRATSRGAEVTWDLTRLAVTPDTRVTPALWAHHAAVVLTQTGEGGVSMQKLAAKAGATGVPSDR